MKGFEIFCCVAIGIFILWMLMKPCGKHETFKVGDDVPPCSNPDPFNKNPPPPCPRCARTLGSTKSGDWCYYCGRPARICNPDQIYDKETCRCVPA